MWNGNPDFGLVPHWFLTLPSQKEEMVTGSSILCCTKVSLSVILSQHLSWSSNKHQQ